MRAATLAMLLLVFLSFSMKGADVVVTIDLKKISMIESSNNPGAYNGKTGATGLCQITPKGALADWNICHKDEQHTAMDLFDPEVNLKIAGWYLNERIPQMLKRYRKPVTIENILISNNAGIRYVRDGIMPPNETRRYMAKYMGV